MVRTRVKMCYRGLLAGLVLFIGGCVGSCDVARLKLTGKATEATVTGYSRIDQDTTTKHYVKYAWQSVDGKEMTGYDKVSTAWSPPSNQKVKILYLPKAKVRGNVYKSKLAENSKNSSLTMMLLGFLLTLAFGAWSFHEMKRISV